MKTSIQQGIPKNKEETPSSIESLLKVSAIAAVVSTLLYVFISFIDTNGFAFPTMWTFKINTTMIYIAPVFVVLFASLFLPWLENYQLNIFNCRTIILSILAGCAFVILHQVAITFLINPLIRALAKAMPYSYSYPGQLLATFITFLPAIIVQIFIFAMLWCAFTPISKMQGKTQPPCLTENAQLRAGLITKWSFIMIIASSGAAAGVYMVQALLDFLYASRTYSGSSAEPLWLMIAYSFNLAICVTLIYTFVKNHVPKFLPKVEPLKIAYTLILMSIYCWLIYSVMIWLLDIINVSGDATVGRIISLVLIATSIFMAKKMIMDDINTQGPRIFLVLLICLPACAFTLWWAYYMGFNLDTIWFMFNIISMTTFGLFILSRSIKWSLTYVYKKSDKNEDSYAASTHNNP